MDFARVLAERQGLQLGAVRAQASQFIRFPGRQLAHGIDPPRAQYFGGLRAEAPKL